MIWQINIKLFGIIKMEKYFSGFMNFLRLLRLRYKRKKNKQLLCEKPFSSMLVDNYNNVDMCPSCLCNKSYFHSKDIINKNNAILYYWNQDTFKYYRECMVYYKEHKICSKKCLYNGLLTR